MVRTSNYNMEGNLTLEDVRDFITNIMSYAVKDNYNIFQMYLCLLLVITVLIPVIIWKKLGKQTDNRQIVQRFQELE